MSGWLKFIAGRVLTILAVLTSVLIAGYVLLYSIAFAYRGANQMGESLAVLPSAHAVHRWMSTLSVRYGDHHPLWRETLGYVWHTWTFHLGYSFTYVGVPLWQQVRMALPITSELVLGSMAIGVVLGVPLGIVAGLRRSTQIDRMLTAFAGIGRGLPAFVTAALAIWLFGTVIRGVLPVHGWTGSRTAILPVLILALGNIGIVVRATRDSLIEALRQDYMRTAKAKGIAHRRSIWHHALKNMVVGLLPFLGPALMITVVGAVWVENLFDIPGLGSFAGIGVANSDGPLMMTTLVILASLVLVGKLGLDVINRWMDPRTRLDQLEGLTPSVRWERP